MKDLEQRLADSEANSAFGGKRAIAKLEQSVSQHIVIYVLIKLN